MFKKIIHKLRTSTFAMILFVILWGIFLTIFVVKSTFPQSITPDTNVNAKDDNLFIYNKIEEIYSPNAVAHYGRIVSCIDGDTIEVLLNFTNQIRTVRILMIDTFETKANKQAEKQAKKFNITMQEVLKRGEQAKEFCTRLWMHDEDLSKVGIKCWKKDRYGRDLCRVFHYDEVTNRMYDYAEVILGWNGNIAYFVAPY